jgi:hypothetical protein
MVQLLLLLVAVVLLLGHASSRVMRPEVLPMLLLLLQLVVGCRPPAHVSAKAVPLHTPPPTVGAVTVALLLLLLVHWVAVH